jgi:FkbM family methyltransferase
LYQFDYVEIDERDSLIPADYNIFLFNYHPVTMSWLNTQSIHKLKGLKFTIVLEVAPNDPFPLCPKDLFDGYVVLDPTLQYSDKRVYAFPRPLEKIVPSVCYQEGTVPIIGSFGFATTGKGFEHVVDAVNKEFTQAIVKINIPYGSFVAKSEALAKQLAEECRSRAKQGIEVCVTHDFMTKQELVNWCTTNMLNCFLYDRQIPGLSATTDQAILSGRPLCVSNNDTFRHILHYIKPYPEWSLREAIENSTEGVKQMQQDWNPLQFARCFEEMVSHYTLCEVNPHDKPYHLRPYSKLFLFARSAFLHIRGQVKSAFDSFRISANLLVLNCLKFKQGSVRNYASYSQAGEDLIVQALFRSFGMEQIKYLDIGANHPDYISNTYLFYKGGSCGVTVEPNPKLFAKHRKVRPNDRCINAGIGFDGQAMADFYLFGGMADGLSTFSREEAERFEKTGVAGIGRFKIKQVLKMPLMRINDIIEQAGLPDFLSIDIEGLDFAVLKTLDFVRFRVKCICVETIHYGEKSEPIRDKELVNFLTDLGYVVYADTGINTIFVDNCWFSNLVKQS